MNNVPEWIFEHYFYISAVIFICGMCYSIFSKDVREVRWRGVDDGVNNGVIEAVMGTVVLSLFWIIPAILLVVLGAPYMVIKSLVKTSEYFGKLVEQRGQSSVSVTKVNQFRVPDEFMVAAEQEVNEFLHDKQSVKHP